VRHHGRSDDAHWFAVLYVAPFAAALYGFYVARLHQVANRVRERLAAKNTERERIARDLHDTLLQSTQGLILRFQAATNEIAEDSPTRHQLELALDRAVSKAVMRMPAVSDKPNSRCHASALPRTSSRAAAFSRQLLSAVLSVIAAPAWPDRAGIVPISYKRRQFLEISRCLRRRTWALQKQERTTRLELAPRHALAAP
jgi:hypothetical protein